MNEHCLKAIHLERCSAPPVPANSDIGHSIALPPITRLADLLRLPLRVYLRWTGEAFPNPQNETRCSRLIALTGKVRSKPRSISCRCGLRGECRCPLSARLVGRQTVD